MLSHHLPDTTEVSAALPLHRRQLNEAHERWTNTGQVDMQHLANSASKVFFHQAALGPAKAELRDLADALVALLQLGLHPGEAVRVRWRGEDREVRADRALHRADAHTWNTAFFAAVLLGDDAMLDTLCAMDLEQFAVHNERGKDQAWLMADAFRAYHIKRIDHVEALNKALEASLRVPADDAGHGRAMDIDGPALELLALLLTRPEDRFHPHFERSLKAHFNHATRQLKKGATDHTTLVSLPLAAMSVLATRMKGFARVGASPYVPAHLVA